MARIIPTFSQRRLRILRWLAVASLFAIGLLRAIHVQFGVTEIHRSNSARNFPFALATASPDDWPHVRGAKQTGESPRESFPKTLGSQGSWFREIPGTPLGGPCVRGNLVCVPVVDVDQKSISLEAFDRERGRPVWETILHRSLPLKSTDIRGLATPACDGQSIYLGAVVDRRLRVSAVDFNGRLRWETDTGPMSCENGRLVSPLLYKELVIVSAEHRGAREWDWLPTSHLTALHRETGDLIWRIRRPNGTHLVTPVLANLAGRNQLILAAPETIVSYDPATGNQLWKCDWPTTHVAESIVAGDRSIYVAAREPRSLVMAIRTDGEGDVSQSHVAWRSEAALVSSIAPVCTGESVIVLSEDGLITSLDRVSGKLQWKRQIAGTYLASPLLAKNELLCLNTQGAAFVVDLAQRGKVVADLAIGNGVIAHPAATRRQLVLRTRAGLLCLPCDIPENPLVNSPDRPGKRL